jgi:hypothetical protein
MLLCYVEGGVAAIWWEGPFRYILRRTEPEVFGGRISLFMWCPLICNWVVENHLPHRVIAYFGLFQTHPPEWGDMDRTLHR